MQRERLGRRCISGRSSGREHWGLKTPENGGKLKEEKIWGSVKEQPLRASCRDGGCKVNGGGEKEVPQLKLRNEGGSVLGKKTVFITALGRHGFLKNRMAGLRGKAERHDERPMCTA